MLFILFLMLFYSFNRIHSFICIHFWTELFFKEKSWIKQRLSNLIECKFSWQKWTEIRKFSHTQYTKYRNNRNIIYLKSIRVENNVLDLIYFDTFFIFFFYHTEYFRTFFFFHLKVFSYLYVNIHFRNAKKLFIFSFSKKVTNTWFLNNNIHCHGK